MNHVALMGRLVANPEINYAQTEKATCIARYRIAVDRRFKQEGQPEADFLNCVAFGKNGEFAQKFLTKGMKIAVEGRIQTGSYEKDGIKHYTFDIVVENHHFCESKQQAATATVSPDPTSIPMGIPSAGITTSAGKHIPADLIEIDEELPF